MVYGLYDQYGELLKSKGYPNLEPGFFSTTNGVSNIEMLSNPYRYMWTIFSCVKTISDRISWLPKYLIDKNDTSKKITNHPVLDLLKYPNEHMRDRTKLMEMIIASLLLPSKNKDGGQCFIIGRNIGDSKPIDFTKGQIPFSIINRHDYEMNPIIENGMFIRWEYRSQSVTESYLNEEVIRISNLDFYNVYGAISNFTPIKNLASQDIQSDIFNEAFFRNNCQVGGLLTTQNELTEEQAKMYLRLFMQQHASPNNAYKPTILGHGGSYKPFQASHNDMQFTQQKSHFIDSILAIYGLNKIALGMYENINYATIKEARKILWQDVYMPFDKKILNAFNDQWLRFVGGGQYELTSDYSNIEALQIDYTKATESMVKLVGIGFTPAHAAEKVGMKLSDEELRKYPWLDEKKEISAPKPLQPMNENDDKNTEDNEDDDDESKKTGKNIHIIKSSKEKYSDYYIKYLLSPNEIVLVQKLNRFFNSQINKLTDNLANALVNKSVLKKSLTISKLVEIDWQQLMLSQAEEDAILLQIIKPVIIDQSHKTIRGLQNELDDLVAWNQTPQFIDRYIKNRAAILSSINKTTFEAVKTQVNGAIEFAMKNTYTPQETAKLVKEALGSVGEYRKNHAKLIARTEVGSVTSKMRYETFRAEGIDKGEWIEANDERVRDTHIIAGNAGPIQLGNTFPGVNMRYPLDPMGEVKEIVRCRCALGAVV